MRSGDGKRRVRRGEKTAWKEEEREVKRDWKRGNRGKERGNK